MLETSRKNLETIFAEAKEITNETIANIINNEAIDETSLTEREKVSVLVYAELAKALDTKDRKLVLDCNYAASKFHNHKDESQDQWLVDYYRLVPTANVNSTLIQFYVSIKFTNSAVTFGLCTSCAKMNRDQFEALQDELHFTTKWDKEHTRAKTSTRVGVSYDEIVDVANAVCAVLASTKVEAEKAKAEKEKAAAEKREKAKAEKEKAAAKKKSAPKKTKSTKKSAKTDADNAVQNDDPLEDITE